LPRLPKAGLFRCRGVAEIGSPNLAILGVGWGLECKGSTARLGYRLRGRSWTGTYTVDEPTKTITLQMESSTYPNQLSVPQKRVITALTAHVNAAAWVGGDGWRRC
jgi:hypothetical protein